MYKKFDTKIRHVTKAGANVFRDLGFSPAEAERLRAAAREWVEGAKERAMPANIERDERLEGKVID